MNNLDKAEYCNKCNNSLNDERKKLIDLFEKTKNEYLIYRGSSFNKDGTLLWAKDDATAYAEGIDEVIKIIKERLDQND